jgi:predicted nucleic acid-binding protein
LICYLDSSALVKRYVLESGSDTVERLLSEADTAGTAWISLVEVVAGLTKVVRTSVLTPEEADSAIRSFRDDWPDLMRMQITEFLLEHAADLARQHGLRGYDAVQLAAATIWQDNTEKPVTFVSFDRHLRLAAQKEGLATQPEEI